MGENGKQAQESVVMELKRHLQACKELPMFRGQINVEQLAKDAGIQRKNLYDIYKSLGMDPADIRVLGAVKASSAGVNLINEYALSSAQ